MDRIYPACRPQRGFHVSVNKRNLIRRTRDKKRGPGGGPCTYEVLIELGKTGFPMIVEDQDRLNHVWMSGGVNWRRSISRHRARGHRCARGYVLRARPFLDRLAPHSIPRPVGISPPPARYPLDRQLVEGGPGEVSCQQLPACPSANERPVLQSGVAAASLPLPTASILRRSAPALPDYSMEYLTLYHLTRNSRDATTHA